MKLKRKDALPISPGVARLRRVIESSLPRVRIEDLLRDVDRRCAFSRAFQPLSGYESRPENIYSTLLALLIAHGMNLGIAAMGQSAQGITVDMLQHVNRWFVREETLKAANAILVNYHNELPLSAVWVGGIASSSDGQRFGLQQSSLLASFYPAILAITSAPSPSIHISPTVLRIRDTSDLLLAPRGFVCARWAPREQHHSGY